MFNEWVETVLWFSLVFGLAGLWTCLSAKRVRWVRAFIVVGASTIVGAFITSFCSYLFNLEPRTYFFDPYRWWRIGIAVGFPVSVTVAMLLWDMQTEEKRGLLNELKDGPVKCESAEC